MEESLSRDKAQIIIEMLYLTINIIEKNGDIDKALSLQSWVYGIREISVRRLRTPNIECPSYRPVTDFGYDCNSASPVPVPHRCSR